MKHITICLLDTKTSPERCKISHPKGMKITSPSEICLRDINNIVTCLTWTIRDGGKNGYCNVYDNQKRVVEYLKSNLLDIDKQQGVFDNDLKMVHISVCVLNTDATPPCFISHGVENFLNEESKPEICERDINTLATSLVMAIRQGEKVGLNVSETLQKTINYFSSMSSFIELQTDLFTDVDIASGGVVKELKK